MANPDPAPPSPPRCLILANPKAGRLALREALARFAGRFARARPWSLPSDAPLSLTLLAEAAAHVGLVANVEALPPRERLGELIRSAEQEGYDTVVAVGGDGTVHNLVQHLVGSPLRLGILPLGTANNFAHALDIPFSLEASLQVLAQGVERQVDVGRIGGEYFIEGAGVGLFADVLCALGTDEAHRHQVFHILRTALPIYWNPRARNLKLTLDGVTHSQEASVVVVSNATYLGESWPIAPEAHLDDGLFNVLIVGALSRWELIRFVFALLRRRHLALPKVQHALAKRVSIRRVHRAHHRLPVHADDHIAALLPVRMEVAPAALRVLAPCKAE
ncbi:MAG TPA: diacylglycerol kinase family protein [Chthonomonadaceae bacterium]|nr:diacylglycerol kinase family protein [Chthonomonadaceae bacterium]